MNLHLLRHRNIALLWWAGLISIAGDWALRIALPIYVLRLTGSPAAVAATVLVSFGASLLVGPVAGAYVDRWDRRRTLIVGNASQALVLLPLLAVDSAGRVWIAVAVAFASAALAQFLGPAENALLPNLVPDHQLPAANSLNTLNNFLGRLTGPALGGVVAASVGLAGAALLDAATFAVASLLCAFMTGVPKNERNSGKRRLGRDVGEGLRLAARNRTTRAVLVFVTLIAVGEGMMDTLFALYVTEALHAGAREMGWMLSAQSVGGILGSLVAAPLARRFPPVAVSATGYALFGLGDLLIFNYPRWGTELWPVVVLFFLIGVPGAVAYPTTMTLLHRAVPDRLRGRVFALLGVCQAVAGMIGALLAGAFGTPATVVQLLSLHAAGFVVAAVLLAVLAPRAEPG
jgi:MFS family permease